MAELREFIGDLAVFFAVAAGFYVLGKQRGWDECRKIAKEAILGSSEESTQPTIVVVSSQEEADSLTKRTRDEEGGG